MAEMAAGNVEVAPEADSPPRRFVPEGLRRGKTAPVAAAPEGRPAIAVSSVPQGLEEAKTPPVEAVPDGRRATAALVSESGGPCLTFLSDATFGSTGCSKRPRPGRRLGSA